jgi:2-polyprenyl-6-hydroxyphenyl methylase/3-demethylubiquinone-9 3-methyltransferase
MTVELRPITAQQAPCKCCGAAANLYGVVDFNKHCEIVRQKGFQFSGIPIYYYQCRECQFLFTTAFDHFTKEDFLRHIYNDEYILVDPDYKEYRPRVNAALLCKLFANEKPRRMLDYGGGEGLLASFLRTAGFPQVDTYDPFVPRFAERPPHRYDCIVCFEVVEHTPDPKRTFAEINDLLAHSGLVVFSTFIQPANLPQMGLNWWYAGPRNGHVSLYSNASMVKLIQPYGFAFASFNENLHVLYRELPAFARHLIKRT